MQKTKKIVIAIDGHSSCGKSTMAKDLAKAVGYTYIDTGAMYRAVTLFAMQRGLFDGETVDALSLEEQIPNIRITFRMNAESNLPETYLNGVCVEAEIRKMEVANRVSHVAALGFVRKALVAMQQQMGEEKGIVMDGRDIGTVVFPHAELKIFVTASDVVRAQRRMDEMTAKGESVSFEEILQNVRKRDLMDSTRKESPLRQAADAIVLDNSALSIAEQKEWLLEQYARCCKGADAL